MQEQKQYIFGRNNELAYLEYLYEQFLLGITHKIIISGLSKSGKTFLINEFLIKNPSYKKDITIISLKTATDLKQLYSQSNTKFIIAENNMNKLLGNNNDWHEILIKPLKFEEVYTLIYCFFKRKISGLWPLSNYIYENSFGLPGKIFYLLNILKKNNTLQYINNQWYFRQPRFEYS